MSEWDKLLREQCESLRVFKKAHRAAKRFLEELEAARRHPNILPDFEDELRRMEGAVRRFQQDLFHEASGVKADIENLGALMGLRKGGE